MDTYYKGSELKTQVIIEAQGFDMDADEWELVVKSGSTKINLDKSDCHKGNLGSLDSSDSSDETEVWYCIVNTALLNVGTVRLIATAHVPDAMATDGVRNEIAVTNLYKLVDP